MTSHHVKGSRWRHAVEQWFADAGLATTVRGIGYAGDDIYVIRDNEPPPMPPLRLSVEAKNHKTITLSKFVDQAVDQAHDYDELALPVCVIHRPARAQVDDAYVVMPGWAFLELVTR
jgi:hypothetical protein